MRVTIVRSDGTDVTLRNVKTINMIGGNYEIRVYNDFDSYSLIYIPEYSTKRLMVEGEDDAE